MEGRQKHFLALCLCIGMVAWLAGAPARADIRVAQIAPMTGPIALEGQEYNLGIRIALDAANASGGINRQKIVLQTLDDEYKPDNTVAMIAKIGATDTVALLLPVGSPALTKVLQEKVLESARIPVVGVVPGAEPFRTPLHPYLYHVRAGDLDQYRKIVQHSLTIGQKRMAVVYVDIPFGKAGLAAVESMLKAQGLEPAVRAALPVTANTDFRDAIDRLRQAAPDVIVLISPGQRAGEFVRAYRASGLETPITTLSYGTSEILCRVASPEKARGIGIVQVLPSARSTLLPLARQFQESFKRFGPKELKPTQSHFEGYVTARVLLDALKRAGDNPTRERLTKALDSMRGVDLGGFVIDFSPTKHTGSAFVDIGIVSRDCQLLY